MPLPGGASDKFGNRYEGKWTVLCLCKLLRGSNSDLKINAIHLEPAGPEGEGVKFVTETSQGPVYHQVKRQQAETGGWTLARLQDCQVLGHCAEKLREPNAQFSFVSTQQATELAELSDCARRASDLNDYESNFLISADKRKWFAEIVAQWGDKGEHTKLGAVGVNPSDPQADEQQLRRSIAFEFLKRVHIHTVSEEDLTEYVELHLQTLVQENPSTVRSVLGDFCCDNVHASLNADDLWECLHKRGFHRQPSYNDASLASTILEHNARFFEAWEWVMREPLYPPELSKLKERINAQRQDVILLTGSAGVGKTGLLKLLADDCQANRIPCLYLSVDTAVLSPDPTAVGYQLGLPASPSISLAAYAGPRRCVLLIDQLDAISGVSGQHPEFLDCVSRIIENARLFETMSVVVACRAYDFEMDHRFRQLMQGAKTISVKPLMPEVTKTVLQRMNIAEDSITEKSLAFYHIPLHLRMLYSIMKEQIGPQRLVPTALLFIRYWNHKRQKIDGRLYPGANALGQVVDILIARQLSSESFWVPISSVIDDHSATVNAMLTEGILRATETQIAFSHQDIADYALGRRFVAKDRDLVEFLSSQIQHLRHRRVVRQVLLEERRIVPAKYRRTIDRLLTNEAIRYHIKKTAIDMMATFEDPTMNEWGTIRPYVENSDASLSRDITIALWHSTSWMKLLVKTEDLSRYLTGDDNRMRGLTLRALCEKAEHLPEVADILEEFSGTSDEWDSLLWNNLAAHNAMRVRRLFELFLTLMRQRIGYEHSKRDFWRIVWDLPESKPNWAAEAIGQYLHQRLHDLSSNLDATWRFLNEDSSGVQVLLKTASEAPTAYVKHVLPFFFGVLEKHSSPILGEAHGLSYFGVWSYRHYQEKDPYEVEGAILLGLERALQHLAENDPSAFEPFKDKLRKTDFEPANFLLIRAFAAGSDKYADEALDYLCSNPLRMDCGWSGASYWATRELIGSIIAECDGRKLRKLRRVIVNYHNSFEGTKKGLRYRGFPQFVMLSAIPKAYHDAKSFARLKEWRRKFGQEMPPPPEPSIGAVTVGSPIPSDKAALMTDDQWLAAIQRYQKGHHESGPEDFLKGGPHELAQVLQNETKKDPKRFCRLAQRFPPTANSTYFLNILIALKECDAEKDHLLAVVRYCHGLPNKPCGRWIGWPIARFAKENIPEDILNIVAWYADNDPDPSSEMWRKAPDRDTVYYGGSLIGAAINSVRGHIAGTICQLAWGDPARLSFFDKQIRKLCTDSVVAVRAEAASILLCMLNHDRDKAIAIFNALCDTGEDRLLSTRHIEQFIKYASVTHYESLKTILERMRKSLYPEVREAGARLTALAHFDNPEASEQVEACLSSDDAELRKGVTKVAAANVAKPDCNRFCVRVLPDLFNDTEKEVRDEAASFLRNLEGNELEGVTCILDDFLDSKALEENTDDLVYAMERSTARLPDITFEVCERLIDLAKDEENQPVRVWHDTGTISKLLFRIYRQTDNQDVEKKCLDLIDNMLRAGVWGVTQELSEFDR